MDRRKAGEQASLWMLTPTRSKRGPHEAPPEVPLLPCRYMGTYLQQ